MTLPSERKLARQCVDVVGWWRVGGRRAPARVASQLVCDVRESL